ncbi:MAG: ribonuclease BN (tRNA processing enzyme), partial [Lentisphaeria bacterium]
METRNSVNTSTADNDHINISVEFLGVGSSSQIDLGHAAIVISTPNKSLLVDCGPGTLKTYGAHIENTLGEKGQPSSLEVLDKHAPTTALPDAIFVTHCHLDHIGDFENIFIKSWFSRPGGPKPKLFVPVSIVPLLHQRVAGYPSVLAEGGVNFWEAFQLIPVGDTFVFDNITWHVIPVRHHAPQSAFGLHLPGAFFYTGDTRPIPEIIAYTLTRDETIFHDCGVLGNPSHTGIDDALR